MFSILGEMLSYPFMARALIVGVLVALCASLLGVSLVLKRFSMIGDGLSHVGFGALAVAYALNLTPLYVAIPTVIVAAFLLLKINKSSNIKGDAAIALIASGSLAVGVMSISITKGVNTDVYNYLFGSILSLSKSDTVLSIILSIVVLILYIMFYPRLFAITFDENFAKATGTNAGAYNTVLAVLTAITVVLGMRMMGAMLISSLIIFPSLSAMRLCKRYNLVVLISAVISVCCLLAGLVVSYQYSTPSGASVVCANIIVFGVLSLVRAIKNRAVKTKK